MLHIKRWTIDHICIAGYYYTLIMQSTGCYQIRIIHAQNQLNIRAENPLDFYLLSNKIVYCVRIRVVCVVHNIIHNALNYLPFVVCFGFDRILVCALGNANLYRSLFLRSRSYLHTTFTVPLWVDAYCCFKYKQTCEPQCSVFCRWVAGTFAPSAHNLGVFDAIG